MSVAAVAKDIATLGTASALTAVFNVVLIFLIPKVASIADYGYWRLFLLYAPYGGILHLGLLDGALLRWAGKPLDDFRDEILPSTKFLFWQNLAVILPVSLILAFALPPNERFIGLAVVGFALIYNMATLYQFGLQAGRQFRPLAISTAAPLGLLLIFVLVEAALRPPTYKELILFYGIAWSITVVWLLGKTRPWQRRKAVHAGDLGKSFIAAGWPILLANISFGLVQRMDRFVVSWAANIETFAQYSLAASALAVPILAIQAAYRVLFPHLAAVGPEQRSRICRTASRLLLLAWVLSLAYYFALEAFITHVLPRYAPSLPIAQILLLGILFLANVQILHASLAYLDGRQRRFLVVTLAALAMGLGLAALAAFALHSLLYVAAAESVTLGLWWASNEWLLRNLSGQRAADWLSYLGIFAAASLSCWFAGRYGGNAAESALVYLGCAAALIALTLPRELRLCVRMLVNHRDLLSLVRG